MYFRKCIALFGVIIMAYQDNACFVVAGEPAEAKDHDIDLTSDLSIESQRLFITSAFKVSGISS